MFNIITQNKSIFSLVILVGIILHYNYINYENDRNSKWKTFKSTSHDDAFSTIKQLITDNSDNIVLIKITTNISFDKFDTKELDELKEKANDKSFLIFVSEEGDKNFHIHWKPSIIPQVLTLKPYKEHFSGEHDKHICEQAAELIANSLRIGHSGIGINQDIKKTKGQIELHFLVDSRNYNLLLLAAESGNVKPIEILLKYGIETQIKSFGGVVTAQGLAWQGRHSDVLLKLLEANLPFPPGMDVKECNEELKSFIETCQELHKMIGDRNEERLIEILQQNPNLRYFYNLSNKSALKASLELKLIDIYELLISKNLSFAPHEDLDVIFRKFDEIEKEDLRDINIKYSKGIPEKHINVLMFNTFVSPDEPDEEGKKELILKAYNALNSDPRLKIILKIVAATKIFKIIFDFHRDSTYGIDPTTDNWTSGVAYFSGRIIIGAKELLDSNTENETFGTLIHELCHYALFTVYQNKADPFPENDQKAMDEFARIAELSKANMKEESVIQSVFENYPVGHQASELIVRPPHLIALYSKEPELLEEVIEIFIELFDYYFYVVVPVMERALPDIESRLAYRPAQFYGKLSDLDKGKVQNAIVSYKNVEVKLVELFPENSDIFDQLTSDHISLMLGNKVLNFNDPQLRYLEEQIDLKWDNLAGNLRQKFLGANLNFQGEIVKFEELNDLYPNAFNALTSQQIIDVLSENEFRVGKEFMSEIKFFVERKFIPEDTKLIAFEYAYGHDYVDNYETELEHIKNRINDKSLQEFTDEFLKKDFDEISQLFDKIKTNSVFRTGHPSLTHERLHFMNKNSSEIIEQAKNEKILILSSEAGAGKTVTFEQLAIEIKNKFALRWVSYLDLPKYTQSYKSNKNTEKLLKNILELNSEKNNFEVRIFEESFMSGNLVLIWNAFDEISPNYNEFVLNVVKSIHETSSNVQLICTRPLYSDQLSKTFKVRSWQLIPFDKEKKEEYLREYFISENISSDKVEEKIEKVEKIIEKLNFAPNSFYYNFETPLMLKLIAEIHENEKLFESANIYGVFEAFIEKKIEIWFRKSESSFSIAKKLLFNGFLKIIMQKFALLNELNLFTSTTLAFKMRKLQIMQKEIPEDFPVEEISRMGILFINGKYNFEFSHKTLGEFFVAQYFIENIFDVDGSVDNDEAELRLELFYYLAQSYGDTQQIIIDFMASFLQMRPQNPKKFNPIISRLLRTKFKNFFIRMLTTNYPEVFEFLFEFFKPDHDLLVDLLHVHNEETFYTAIVNPNYFSIFTDSKEIQNLVQNCLTDEEFEKFLTGKNQEGKIWLGIQYDEILDTIEPDGANNTEINPLSTSFWESLTIEEQKEFFVTAMSPKIYLCCEVMFKVEEFPEYENFWTNCENLLTQYEMQDALGDALVLYIEVFPNNKAGHKKFLNLLLEKAEKFLSNSQIFEMFLAKNILHEAHWDEESFVILWNFLTNHTNEDEIRKILLQDDLDDKNFYFYASMDDLKDKFTGYIYNYFYYDFTPFKILHRALTVPYALTFDFTIEIYQKYFNDSEIIEIILSSNDFLYYVIGILKEEHFKEFAVFLKELFKGNEKLLEEFLDRKIEPTNLSVLELYEDFRELPHSQKNWLNNLETLWDLICCL